MITFSINGVTYEFDVNKYSYREAQEIKALTGLELREYTLGVTRLANIDAIAAMVYLAKKRAGEDVAFEDIDFDLLDLAGQIIDVDESSEGAE